MNNDADFMSEIEAARHMKPTKASNALLVSIACMVVLFFIWAGFSKVEILTRGSGKVVPSQEIQVVQSLEGGILQELLVQQGDMVEKGQPLLRISDVLFSSEEKGAEARFVGLSAKKARLDAEAQGKPFVMPETVKAQNPQIAANEESLYRSRQQELENALSMLDNKIDKATAEMAEANAQIGRHSSSRSLAQKELDITSRLVRQKAAPELEAIRLQREVSDLDGQIRAAREKIAGLSAELKAAQKEKEDQRDKFRSQALGELNAVETEIAGLKESLKSMGDRVDRTELRSPVKGIVNNIAVKTIGGVIEPAHKLVEIVPMDDDVKVVAKVAPSEIAFLSPGQDVNVSISAYDPQRYGRLPGKLTRIGANSVTDREGNIFFEIEARTQKNYLGSAEKPLPITPGMVAQVEVITGRRTILEYLMKPVLNARDSALRER